MKRLIKLILVVSTLAMLLPAYAVEYTKVTYIHNDGFGNPVAASDEQGNLEWRIEYYPYGQEYSNTEVNRKSDIGYAGKPYDNEIGLSYFGARWYDPDTGRFTGIDPAPVKPFDWRTFNRYSYGFNNPFRFYDPDGRESKDAVWAALGEENPNKVYTDAANNVIQGASAAGDALDGVPIPVMKGAAIGALGVKLVKGSKNLKGIPLKEAKQLMSKWDKSTYNSLSDSIRDHAKRHGFGNDIPKYLRKAANFNKKGAQRKVLENGATRWNRKNGEFLIERKGKIVTYGINK